MEGESFVSVLEAGVLEAGVSDLGTASLEGEFSGVGGISDSAVAADWAPAGSAAGAASSSSRARISSTVSWLRRGSDSGGGAVVGVQAAKRKMPTTLRISRVRAREVGDRQRCVWVDWCTV
jgi:hypothetical protein